MRGLSGNPLLLARSCRGRPLLISSRAFCSFSSSRETCRRLDICAPQPLQMNLTCPRTPSHKDGNATECAAAAALLAQRMLLVARFPFLSYNKKAGRQEVLEGNEHGKYLLLHGERVIRRQFYLLKIHLGEVSAQSHATESVGDVHKAACCELAI